MADPRCRFERSLSGVEKQIERALIALTRMDLPGGDVEARRNI